MSDTKPAGPIPLLSVETGLIVSYVAARRESLQTIPDDEFTALIGVSIKGNHGRGYMQSARRILFRDQHILLERVRRVGFRIASNFGVVQAMVRDVSASRRALGRAARKAEAVDEKALGEAERNVYSGHVATINTLRLLSKPASIRRAVAPGGGPPLTSAAVLELFR